MSSDAARLVILHTNDVHSRIEPFPMDGGRFQGLGGAARRATLIEQVRSQHEQVLLLDAGDMFQGTPYFNFYGGELEFKLMSKMGYDAATLGNHDFDAGIEGLHRQLPHVDFALLNANYDLSDTILHDKVAPYRVFERGDLRIGVFGVGIELEGLVPASLYQNTRYLSPVEASNTVAARLKQDLGCDYVICLSHLGYRYRDGKIDDLKLARSTQHIDLILGGHTHTFLDAPTVVQNASGQPVMINQVGWAGIQVGKIELTFERSTRRFCSACEVLTVTE